MQFHTLHAFAGIVQQQKKQCFSIKWTKKFRTTEENRYYTEFAHQIEIK